MSIILVDENGDRLEDVSLEEARRMAKEAGKNLILLNANKNVYKIADEGKLKYEQKQKQKQQRAQRRTHKIKEVQFSPVIDTHDLDIKASRIRDFLSKGLRTKIIMKFKRRQIAHKDIGLKKMTDLLNTLTQEDIAVVDRPPTFEGRNLVAFVVPPKG